MRLILVTLLALFPLCLSGQAVPEILHLGSDGFATLDLRPYLSLYTDPGGELTIEDMLASQTEFVSGFDAEQPTPYPTAHWLRMEVSADQAVAGRWLIFKNRWEHYEYLGALSYVDAYFVREGQIVAHHRTGYYVPKKEKTVQERAAANIIPVSLDAGEHLTVYLRLAGVFQHRETHIEPVLSEPLPNISYTTDENKWNIYGGQAMYLIIGFYVLVFWFFTREQAYLYFGLFCLLFSVHYFNIEPASSMVDLFFPNRPHLANPAFTFFGMGTPVFLLLFGRAFSETPGRLPRWDKYLVVVTGLYVIYYFYVILTSLGEPYGNQGNAVFLLVFVLILPLAVKFFFGSHRMAKIFGLGVLWFLLWNTVGILVNVEIIRMPFNPWPVGQIGLLVIYAVGLGYKLLEQERQKAQAERIRELDAVKSRFFANISHEFRTPLSLILGPVNQVMENVPASEALEEAEDVPVKGKHLQVIKRNALRLQNLVDQLLDLSKLDSGKMRLQVAEGHLTAFLRSIVASFESLAEHKNIHFQSSFPAEPEAAYFDRDKLEKILVNLLSNAFKFTPEHGRIRVNVADNGGSLKIQVSDSGIGMPVSETDKIFDRFYQMGGTEEKGTGIGLALVKELVELHGGQISVDSVEGEGTTFKVSLPYRKILFPEATLFKTEMDGGFPTINGERTALHEGMAVPEQRNEGPADQPLVLIVEDHPDLRRYIRENIESGYQVLIAENGQRGLDLALEKVPDIIISDVMMPEINGFELCEKLKTDPHTSHIPIILLTARAGQEHKIEGLQQGADAYLTKPFDMRELRVRLANLIEQRQQLREKFSSEMKLAPSAVTLNSVDERFLQDVMQQIETNLDNEFFSVEELAHSVGFSRSQLHRKIKALTGKSSNQLIRDFRLTRAKELLEQRAASVSEVAYQVGYSNLSYFSKCFKETYGISPSEAGRRD